MVRDLVSIQWMLELSNAFSRQELFHRESIVRRRSLVSFHVLLLHKFGFFFLTLSFLRTSMLYSWFTVWPGGTHSVMRIPLISKKTISMTFSSDSCSTDQVFSSLLFLEAFSEHQFSTAGLQFGLEVPIQSWRYH